MKKVLLKLVMILVYICLLLYFARFSILKLIDIPQIIMVMIGMLLLSVSHMRKGLENKEIRMILGRNALITSYIETFILIFVRMSDTKGYDNLMSDIGMNCLPLLYGFIIYQLFNVEEERLPEPQSGRESMKEQTVTTDIRSIFQDNGLTNRETEVAVLMKNGLSNKEIAEELFISETTVKKHVTHIYEKLGISNRGELKKY